MKKIGLPLLILLLLAGMILPVWAETVTPTPETTEEPTEETEPTPVPVVDPLHLAGPSAILIDGKTGMVLYEKNGYASMDPTSLTKILTVYLAIQKLPDDTVLTASSSAIDGFDRSTSHVWLTYGEQLQVVDLEYAAMLSSANDATDILAEGVSGSLEGFVTYMNQIVEALALKDTHFTNVTGNYDGAQVSSAYDLAMLTRLAMQDERFATLYGTGSYTMAPTNKQTSERTFVSGNDMLRSSDFTYEYTTGGKTGYNEQSGYGFSCTATKDNMDLIGVVLGEESEVAAYQDMTALFEYGYASYKTVVVSGSAIEPVTVDIVQGNTKIAQATFTAPDSFNVLLTNDTDESSITTDVEIRNQSDPELCQGLVILSIDGVVEGQMEMTKELVYYDTSFKATTWPKIMDGFNKLSIAVLAIFFGIKMVVFVRQHTKLPE